MNLGNSISIIWAVVLAAIWFIKYLKDKKTYWLLAVLTAFMMIYINTPLANDISKTFENIFVGILFLLLINESTRIS